MASINIKTKPYSYFYSDSIHLNPNKSLSLSLDSLSPTELNDIYEGLFIVETLDGDNKEAFKAFYDSKMKNGKWIGNGGGDGSSSTTIINTTVQANWATTDW